ncbi:MAG: hypothetical protein AAB592_03985, partial [Patescibacteria group bacterium]
MESQRTYEIDRKTASQLLKVAVRTIDRYIRGGKLSARQINGRVWLSKQEIIDLKRGTTFLSSENEDATESIDLRAVPRIEPPRHEHRESPDPGFYRDLYSESSKLLEERTKKLEQAQYRIGQLEAQSMSPHQTARSSHATDDLEDELVEKE